MPARRCYQCRVNYPYRKGSAVKCPSCGTALQYASTATPDTDWPLEVPEVLPDLTEEQRGELAADWSAVEAEARKRGRMWSVADILGEMPSDKAA